MKTQTKATKEKVVLFTFARARRAHRELGPFLEVATLRAAQRAAGRRGVVDRGCSGRWWWGKGR